MIFIIIYLFDSSKSNTSKSSFDPDKTMLRELKAPEEFIEDLNNNEKNYHDVDAEYKDDQSEDESILETDFNLEEPVTYHKDQVYFIDQMFS